MDPALYPRSYSASFGWKLFLGTSGFTLGIGGLFGVWYFGTGHEIHNDAQLVVLVTISLTLAVLGFWSAIAPLLTTVVVLTPQELQIPGLFKVTVVSRRDIKGYRTLNVEGIKVLELESVRPGHTKTENTRISLLFKLDDAFGAWFEGIPNFDALEMAASVRDIEQDRQLGNTPRERLENVDRARQIARVLNIGGIVAAAWAYFYPEPYTLMFVVNASLPWLALWLWWQFKGSFSWDNPGWNSVYADPIYFLITPGLILALRAVYDVNLIDPTKLIAPTVYGLAVMLACLVWTAPAYRAHLGKLALIALLLAAYPAGSIAIANSLFDGNESKAYRVEVLQQRQTVGKGATQYFKVPAWGPYEDVNEIRVSRDLYLHTDVGQVICVLRHPGALGLEWYSAHSC